MLFGGVEVNLPLQGKSIAIKYMIVGGVGSH